MYRTYSWPIQTKHRRHTSRSFNRLLYKRKEPGEGSGAASTHHRETYFQFFDPPAFCTKKQEARGLHSVSAIFDKIALSTTTKEPGGRQDKKTFWLFVSNSKKLGGYTHWVHFSRKSAHQPQEETKKNISGFHFKKNLDQVYNNPALETQLWNARGLVDGKPYGPPIDRTIRKWGLSNKAHGPIIKMTRNKSNVQNQIYNSDYTRKGI